MQMRLGERWKKNECGEMWSSDIFGVKHLGSQGRRLQALEKSPLECKWTWWARADWMPSTSSRIRRSVQIPQLGFIMCHHMHDPHEETPMGLFKGERLFSSHKGFPITAGQLWMQDMHTQDALTINYKPRTDHLCGSCRLRKGKIKSLWNSLKLFLAMGECWNE